MMGGTVDDRSGLLAELAYLSTFPPRLPRPRGPRWAGAILAVYRAAAQPVMAEAVRDLENAAARRGCRSSPPRTPTWEPTKANAAQRSEPERASKCWTGSGTGGWCRIQRAVPRFSTGSGRLSTSDPNLSDPRGMIEPMFEGVDEAGLVATIEDATRAEAAAAARRSAAIAELVTAAWSRTPMSPGRCGSATAGIARRRRSRRR